jgi:ribosome-binding protein aMBF1 (putative translation factor)
LAIKSDPSTPLNPFAVRAAPKEEAPARAPATKAKGKAKPQAKPAPAKRSDPSPAPPAQPAAPDPGAFVPLTGEQMRLARYFLGWSQTDLGKHADLSRATISRIEDPSPTTPKPTEKALRAIRQTIEARGLIIIEADQHGGPGIRRGKAPA